MDAYILSNGKVRIPVAVSEGELSDSENGLLGDATKDVDHDDPEAQKWIKWYAKRGEVLPRLPVVNRRADDDLIETTNPGKFGNFKAPE